MSLSIFTHCFPLSSQPPTHSTPTHFRNYLTTYPATSIKRVVHLPSAHRLTATPQGGDCFFHALSWSLPRMPPPQSLRERLSAHVRSHISFYATALLARGFAENVAQARENVHTFCASVLAHGPSGHWLGALWGELEILACAKSFQTRFELYTFDVSKQLVRPYFVVGEASFVVRLLFTGHANAGHFDALLPVRTPLRDFWKRMVKPPLKSV